MNCSGYRFIFHLKSWIIWFSSSVSCVKNRWNETTARSPTDFNTLYTWAALHAIRIGTWKLLSNTEIDLWSAVPFVNDWNNWFCCDSTTTSAVTPGVLLLAHYLLADNWFCTWVFLIVFLVECLWGVVCGATQLFYLINLVVILFLCAGFLSVPYKNNDLHSRSSWELELIRSLERFLRLATILQFQKLFDKMLQLINWRKLR